MDVTPEVEKLLEAAVKRSFPDLFDNDIRIEKVVVDEDAGEIRVTLSVSSDVDPAKLADGYFGLTGKVRKSLATEGGLFSNFFPIISPAIGHKVHA